MLEWKFLGYRNIYLLLIIVRITIFNKSDFIVFKKMPKYQKYTSVDNPPRPRSFSANHPVESRDLMQGRDQVEILHRGETYRLRITRQGKLILTK
jgi:hemin uptake protein HemP